MPTSLNVQQIGGIRFAGYFAVILAALFSLGWVPSIRHQYEVENQWPGVSGTVFQGQEESQEVDPPSARSRRYWVYWAEYMVILDAPVSQCPGEIWSPQGEPQHCVMTVKTRRFTSREAVTRSFIRHPRGSRTNVKYDPGTGNAEFGGEPAIDVYPWDKIVITVFIFVFGAVMVIFSRNRLAALKAENSDPALGEGHGAIT